jgi:trans-aconitate methyltransferase
MHFQNTYEDKSRATAYDELDLSGTYHLAFRDLPDLIKNHVAAERAVDFGCGTGRSTRFLHKLGLSTVGLDISAEMVAVARTHDPDGDYRVIEDGDFSSLDGERFDLVLSAFTFDNIPGYDHKVRLFSGLNKLLGSHGRLISIVSTPEIYTNEWITFSTRDYPENATAGCGDVVRIVTTTYSDQRPVEDILWPDADYRDIYQEVGFEVERFERPLATGDEGMPWISETRIAPWSIYVLKPQITSDRED